MERATVYYSGRVQGVGFRQTVLELTHTLEVTGSVKNLEDGSVELIIEGDRQVIDALLKQVSERMAHFIRETKLHRAGATGRFQQFSIEH